MQLIMTNPNVASSGPSMSSLDKNRLFSFIGGGGGASPGGLPEDRGFDMNNFVYERSSSWSSTASSAATSSSSSSVDDVSNEFGPGSEYIMDRRKEQAHHVVEEGVGAIDSSHPTMTTTRSSRSSSSRRRRSGRSGTSSSSNHNNSGTTRRRRRTGTGRRRRARVTFAPNECMETVHQTLHRESYSNSEIDSCWFSREELDQCKRRSSQLAAVLNHAGVAMEDFDSLLNGVVRML